MARKRDTILLLKVSKAISEGKTPYEATRGNWVLGENRVKREILYVAGLDTVKERAVVGAFIPETWYQIVKVPYLEHVPKKEDIEIGRYCFDGVEAPANILEDLNKVYEQLLERFGVGGEKAYITMDELNELLLKQ